MSLDVGDLGLWYFDSAHGYGSFYDTSHNDNWLFDNHFISSGARRGSVVANNSEFAWDRDPHTTVIVCTGYNYSGLLRHHSPEHLWKLHLHIQQ